MSSGSTSPCSAALTQKPSVKGFQHRGAKCFDWGSSVSAVSCGNICPKMESEKPHVPGFSNLGCRDSSTTTDYCRSCMVEKEYLKRFLHEERTMRLVAERRTLEENEKGARNVIIIEAIYGARLLYSILCEGVGIPPALGSGAGDSPASVRNNSPMQLPRRRPLRQLRSPARDSIESRTVANAPASSCIQMANENRMLRVQLEQYKSIDTADRRETNELHRNMQAVIDQLTRERDALYAELSCRKLEHDTPEPLPANGGRILPQREGASWHLSHIIDPSAYNVVESPENAFRLRVLPM